MGKLAWNCALSRATIHSDGVTRQLLVTLNELSNLVFPTEITSLIMSAMKIINFVSSPNDVSVFAYYSSSRIWNLRPYLDWYLRWKKFAARNKLFIMCRAFFAHSQKNLHKNYLCTGGRIYKIRRKYFTQVRVLHYFVWETNLPATLTGPSSRVHSEWNMIQKRINSCIFECFRSNFSVFVHSQRLN